ncbi:hypothetical protein NR402_17625 [Acidithiobacillus ferrooxidans]|jgi:pyruvate kinase|uniref:hypothetical protein n=1 Tax=Acidithiobacillus TaxID=119977 RepID=UPI000B0E8402|nr:MULTISPECIES: hypothetical protein [Acidithiobacillus]MCL5956715.1 hypothetical protein [Gammaproteobacteria bacterium]MCR2832066.1 hypothetical protein [Acidithiobacillus ferrooxidans]
MATELGVSAASVSGHEPHASTCRRIYLRYGVYPVEIASPESGWEYAAHRWLLSNDVKKGLILLTQGPSKGHPGGTNRLEIIHLDVSATQ